MSVVGARGQVTSRSVGSAVSVGERGFSQPERATLPVALRAGATVALELAARKLDGHVLHDALPEPADKCAQRRHRCQVTPVNTPACAQDTRRSPTTCI